ncbi:Mitogen-activated protein kinase kinase kinase 4, partial [Operophtera brumata]
MAPEVFMKSSGHGRAADIWSVGCVVTEMASGKRPFSEYDSNYQIMFMVGMGSRPAIPGALSEEGRQFCALCLTHEPDLRPRADKLMMHTFLMVRYIHRYVTHDK